VCFRSSTNLSSELFPSQKLIFSHVRQLAVDGSNRL
jgi:hypothetical protein